MKKNVELSKELAERIRIEKALPNQKIPIIPFLRLQVMQVDY
jgi:hypothetical protein